MGWRDFKNPYLVEKTELTEKTPAEAEKIPFIPLIPPGLDSENHDLAFMEQLTETELEYYLNLLEIMQSEKFGLDRGAAEREAFEIVDEYRSRKKKRLELPSQQKGNGKEIAQIFFGKKSDGKEKD